jgi:beta-phosphoglucomutase-like phosphatase (HAD superfamily)
MTPLRPRALIRDPDGVLADTEPLHQKAWDAVLDGIPFEQVAAARARWVGMASVDIVKELIRTFGLAVPAEELLV